MYKIKHTDYIESKYLFWGHPSLTPFFSKEDIDYFCELEFFDWISCLYWGEGVAMSYALKMSEISVNRDKWLAVYRDEHKHQTAISNWMIERNLAPSPKNKLIIYALKKVESLNSSMSEEEIINTMYSTQVFFEELFHSLLKFRLKFVKDRDLKAIFYQIFIDESEHLVKAKSEIVEMLHRPKKNYQVLSEKKSLLFPLGIVKKHLSNQQIKLLKDKQGAIVDELIDNAKNHVNLYKPLTVLHKFTKISGYNCVVCSPLRHDGLHLEPKAVIDSELIFDEYEFPQRCEGFNLVVHGGYVGMVLDEMMCYAPILKLNLLAVTSKLEVSFHSPVKVGQKYRVEARIIGQENQILYAEACIKSLDGKVMAKSSGVLYLPKKTQATKILGDLGKEALVQEMLMNEN